MVRCSGTQAIASAVDSDDERVDDSRLVCWSCCDRGERGERGGRRRREEWVGCWERYLLGCWRRMGDWGDESGVG